MNQVEPNEKNMPILLGEIHEWLLKDQNKQRQINHLNRYFGGDYSGKLFEYFVGRSKSNTFGYNNISWYSSADVYYIKTKDKK